MIEFFNLTGYIIDFESGELDDQGILKLFSYLIKTGLAWQFQGSYGRIANNFIDNNAISEKGEILI